MKLQIDINNDIEYVLNKIAKKRKITIGKLIVSILGEWLDDYDNEQYQKSLPKNKS